MSIKSMSPNIDITHETHGKVKDYAENTEQNLTEAYEELLNAGIESLKQQSGN